MGRGHAADDAVTRGVQRADAGGERRAAGDDVIDQHDSSALRTTARRERAAHVSLAVVAIALGLLLGGDNSS